VIQIILLNYFHQVLGCMVCLRLFESLTRLPGFRHVSMELAMGIFKDCAPIEQHGLASVTACSRLNWSVK
jgi:hypothetical protein